MNTFTPFVRRNKLLEAQRRQRDLPPLAHRLESEMPVIARRGKRDAAPLSFAQLWWWRLNQQQPNNRAENVASAYRLKGKLNVDAVNNAINAIVKRHEILRTNFSAMDGGEPVQIVRDFQPVSLSLVELGECVVGEPGARLQLEIAAWRNLPFNISHDLPFRAALLELGPADHVLLLLNHPMVGDLWSAGVLWREFALQYRAGLRGKSNPLPELAFQYADFAVWQRQRSGDSMVHAHLSYWNKQLSELRPLQLPTDRDPHSFRQSRSKNQHLIIPESVLAQLKMLSGQEEASLFMTLLAAFQVLLYRYTGQNDIALASPTEGRKRLRDAAMIGCFTNTLVFRSDLSGNPTFRELLKRVRRSSLETYEHIDFPLEQVLADVTPNQGRVAPCQIIFEFEKQRRPPLALPGLFLEPVEIDSHISPYDLHATAIERDKQLVLGLEYRTDLFDDSTIARVLNHFQMLLERIVEDVDQPIATLPLVSEAETRQLLIDWNKSETSHLDDHCVHELFEHQAIRSQDSVAVVFNDQQITYKELNNKANQLAHYLLKLGVGSDILVGLYLETSPEVIIALLAVHKAGSAYLPLDPNDPLQRLLHISNETKLAVLLSQRSLAESFPEHIAKVICLDSEWPTIAQESENNPGLKVAPTNLAYVIYTSGSTGLPKGVEIEHRSLTNFTRWAMTAYELAPTDRVLQFASLSTDTAVEEIFPCLLSGATLVLRTDSMLRSLPGFLQGCREARVTVLDLPTGYWHELVDEVSTGPRTNLGNLRLVIIGGEQASAARLVRWRGWAGQESRLINTYGPTEATVVSTYWEADDSLKEAHSRSIVPIGRPIMNTQLYVLDDYLNPVPMGVRGEIYIGGLGLARGYLKSPELNTEKFVTHPFSTKLGARLYKTGDLARYRPDGNLEFLGRIDNQIKIRGYRVELHEIEAVLCQHGSVKDAVALAPENMPAYQRLVAYVVPNQFVAPTASELRSFLNATLPDYMVPSGFVLLETLPLTPNGKVDRQMLSTLDRPELKDGFVAPRTPDEKIMANIWAETLKLKQISLYDNFFDLGRHSFLAMEVISRVRKVFGIDVPFRELFAVPTVAGMAATMMRKRSMHQSVHHVNGQSNGS